MTMRVEKKCWEKSKGWCDAGSAATGLQPQLVLAFGARRCLRQEKILQEIRELYPGAHLCACSTAGEICGTSIYDNSIVLAAVEFSHTIVKGYQMVLQPRQDSRQAGQQLAGLIEVEELAHVLVFADGLHTNGSQLLEGMLSVLPPHVSISGGMAGDGNDFGETLVFWDSPSKLPAIIAIAFYGSHLRVKSASRGGYDPFGPRRLITRSQGNVLYEMDGQSALELYKKYLGEYADQLPASALGFPLAITGQTDFANPVRSILAVDEEGQSLIFGGDVPTGSYARMMKANLDRLIDSAVEAAELCREPAEGSHQLALLISCFGRRSVLKQRTEEELEAVSDVLGSGIPLIGFYSYGEFSPFEPGGKPEFHNQTMTITVFSED